MVKKMDPRMVELAAAAGLKEFGENYVKDLETKRSAAPDAIWHFVGRLQSNKVERAIRATDVIHTLEPGRASAQMAEKASAGERLPECLIEVDLAGGRVGVSPEALAAFADEVIEGGVPVRGLMAVAPLGEDPRPGFSRMRTLRDDLRERHPEVVDLSMGMSADLEVAVEEGATMVRVGTAIFGRRRR